MTRLLHVKYFLIQHNIYRSHHCFHHLGLVDDSHAVGFMGEKGKGTHEYNGVIDRVDIITGTLGKALGGASGGYTSGKKEIINILRQRSRPYLFSNTVAPSIVSASLKVLDELNFDYVEHFLFQCRPGTPAEKMKGHISKKNAKRRFRQLIFKSITVEKRSKKNRKFTADLLW